MKKFVISCMSAGLVLGDGNTKEEALSEVPDYCEECTGKSKIYKDEIRWGCNDGHAPCSITKRQERDAHVKPEDLKAKCEKLRKMQKEQR